MPPIAVNPGAVSNFRNAAENAPAQETTGLRARAERQANRVFAVNLSRDAWFDLLSLPLQMCSILRNEKLGKVASTIFWMTRDHEENGIVLLHRAALRWLLAARSGAAAGRERGLRKSQSAD